MVITDKKLHAALGQRLCGCRIAPGLTQHRLAESIGVAHQTLAHYDVGLLYVAAQLPLFSKTLALLLDELFAGAAKASKRRPAPIFQAQIERIGSLPHSTQHVLLDTLDTAINSANAQAA